MTYRPAAASRSQNATSQRSIDAAPPMISSTAGSSGSPTVSTHNSAPFVSTFMQK